MNGETWIELSYIFTGILSIIFCIGLFYKSNNKSILIAGKILLIITGIIWITFGLVDWDLQSDSLFNLMISRTVAAIISSLLGLLIIGGEIEKLINDKFIKYYTLLSGFLLLSLDIIGLFVFDISETWIMLNISFTVYFSWFGVFGLRVLMISSLQNKKLLFGK